MIDWEKLREMMRKDLSRFISQDKLSDKDYCDLKLILSNMERSYTNEMFENQNYDDSRRASYAPEHYISNRASGRVAPYYDKMEMSDYYGAHYGRNGGYNYNTHTQEDIFKSQLQNMMHTAEDANTRRVIQEAMEKLR